MNRRLLTVCLSAVALVTVTASNALAQSSDLDQVAELASAGRAQEARAVLAEWWTSERTDASRLDTQRGFWLRGRLTEDPDQAARDFRRLMVEYPGGPFTDMALYRLAQAAYTAGDGPGARELMASLARDYPGSAVRREAEAWFVGAGSSAPMPPRPTTTDSSAAPTEVTSDSVPPSPPTNDEIADPTPVASGSFSVQLGAFSNPEGAELLRIRAESAGLEARTVNVRGSSLLHVRVGRFDSSGEAGVSFRRVTDLGFTAVVVQDADREEPARE